MKLSSHYLGLPLANPLVASASPLTRDIDSLKRLEDGGVSAVVLPSLFEEQIEHDTMTVNRLHEMGAEVFAEASSGYFADLGDYNTGPESYLELIANAKRTLSVPVIASLNGASPGGWTDYARLMQDAGADALELNVYFIPADPTETSAAVEQRYLEIVFRVAEALTIPMTVKMSPFFSAPANMALKMIEAGAHGLVLFNRFMQPDIDLETLEVTPNLQLSTSTELRLPLRWIAILRDHTEASIAATTGVHTVEDILKLLLAGADVAYLASVLLRNGPSHTRKLLAGIEAWLDDREYESVAQLRGSVSHARIEDPIAFERSNYMNTLWSFTTPDSPSRF